MSKYSYVVVSAEKAKELAENKLARIKSSRITDVRNYIKLVVETINNSWYRRLFRMKPITAAEVEAHERKQPSWDNYIWTVENVRYDEVEKLAQRILLAVKLGNPLHLSLEDVTRLS